MPDFQSSEPQPDPEVPVYEFVGEEVTRYHGGHEPPTDEPLKRKIKIAGDVEVWVRGWRGDLVDIVDRRAILWRDYLRNDTDGLDEDDIKGSSRVIAVRYGRERDLATFYGLVYNDDGHLAHVDVFRFLIRDGQNIRIEVVHNEIFVTYGHEKDLRTRFCYSPVDGWSRSPGNNRDRGDFPLCSQEIGHVRKP